LKIIGIFTKLCADGRTQYQQYMPRVWRYIKAGLKNPVMSELAQWFRHYNVSANI
jgi:aminoglycoside/choline kinase family phosphotransferase